MKLITFIFFFSTINMYASFFKDAFDRQYITSDVSGNGVSIKTGIDYNNTSLGYSLVIGNGQGTYQTVTGPIMQGLIRMYKATNDINYLTKFIVNSDNVQNYRDDRMQFGNEGDVFTSSDGLIFVPGSSITRPNSATWSMYMKHNNNPVWYASLIYSAEIIYPMAEFIYLVKFERPYLQNYPCPLNNFYNYLDYANWLEEEILETINSFSGEPNYLNFNTTTQPRDIYKTVNGVTGFHKGITSSLVETNFSTAMGRVIALMSVISSDNNTKVKMRAYLTQIKYNWITQGHLTNYGNGYIWTHQQDGSIGLEEIAHGALAIQMAKICNDHNILDIFGNPLYNDQFIKKLVYTFTLNIYNSPINIGPSLDGSSNSCVGCNGTSNFNNKMLRALSSWLPLSNSSIIFPSSVDNIDSDIYNICLDVFMTFVHNYPEGMTATGSYPLGLSYLAFYYKKNKELLNPITVNRVPGNGSLWAGVDGGDIDGDGKDEIIGVRNSVVGPKIISFKISQDNSFNYLYKMDFFTSLNTPNLDFEDVAVGNFNPQHIGDEVISITNSQGNIYMYENTNNLFVESMEYTVPSSYSDWKGIASGNFIKGNNKDEIVTVRNLDGRFFLYEYNNNFNTLEAISSWEIQNSNSPNWASISCGDLDGDSYNDDIVALNNNNGAIYIFYYDDTINEFINGPIYQLASSNSNWTDVTCGKFCSNQQKSDDIIVKRSLDGDLSVFRIINDEFVAISGSHFIKNEKIDVLGSGNFTNKNKDQLVYCRNFDGDVFLHYLNLPCEKIIAEPIITRSKNKKVTQSFKVFPNPCANYFCLSSINSIKKIELFDMRGKLIMSKENLNNNKIDISRIDKGMYLLIIHLNSGEFLSEKILVN